MIDDSGMHDDEGLFCWTSLLFVDNFKLFKIWVEKEQEKMERVWLYLGQLNVDAAAKLVKVINIETLTVGWQMATFT